MNETELIHQICNGNPQAFRFLVKKYERLVFHIAGRLLRQQEDLEDVCQEVFLKVHQKLPDFRGNSKLSTWIATIAYRVAINHVKKRKPFTDIDDDETKFIHEDMITEEHPQKIAEENEMKAQVKSLLEKLPNQYKTVLSMYHLEELGYKEIVEITGLPEGTVKNYIFRARKMLKELLIKNELMVDRKI